MSRGRDSRLAQSAESGSARRQRGSRSRIGESSAPARTVTPRIAIPFNPEMNVLPFIDRAVRATVSPLFVAIVADPLEFIHGF